MLENIHILLQEKELFVEKLFWLERYTNDCPSHQLRSLRFFVFTGLFLPVGTRVALCSRWSSGSHLAKPAFPPKAGYVNLQYLEPLKTRTIQQVFTPPKCTRHLSLMNSLIRLTIAIKTSHKVLNINKEKK